ncbi:MAG: protease complex subunit PrcB family protein [Planctomycetota bacterium]|nr:protease complex subunit PrcB family protein [Planctomycetota bacterium]
MRYGLGMLWAGVLTLGLASAGELRILRALEWWPDHKKAERLVFQSRGEMEKVWLADGGKEGGMPQVDFEKQTVLAFFDPKPFQVLGVAFNLDDEGRADRDRKRVYVLYTRTKYQASWLACVPKTDAELVCLDLTTAEGQQVLHKWQAPKRRLDWKPTRKKPGQFIFRSRDELAAVWLEGLDKPIMTSELPPVDFSTEFVAAVFAGERSAGYSIRVENVEDDPRTWGTPRMPVALVCFRETPPAANLGAPNEKSWPSDVVVLNREAWSHRGRRVGFVDLDSTQGKEIAREIKESEDEMERSRAKLRVLRRYEEALDEGVLKRAKVD